MFGAGPVAEKIGTPNLYYGSDAMLVGIGVVGYTASHAVFRGAERIPVCGFESPIPVRSSA
jgi:hypothetical protein